MLIQNCRRNFEEGRIILPVRLLALAIIADNAVDMFVYRLIFQVLEFRGQLFDLDATFDIVANIIEYGHADSHILFVLRI